MKFLENHCATKQAIGIFTKGLHHWLALNVVSNICLSSAPCHVYILHYVLPNTGSEPMGYARRNSLLTFICTYYLLLVLSAVELTQPSDGLAIRSFGQCLVGTTTKLLKKIVRNLLPLSLLNIRI